MQLHRADGRTAEWESSLLIGKKKTGISPGLISTDRLRLPKSGSRLHKPLGWLALN